MPVTSDFTPAAPVAIADVAVDATYRISGTANKFIYVEASDVIVEITEGAGIEIKAAADYPSQQFEKLGPGDSLTVTFT